MGLTFNTTKANAMTEPTAAGTFAGYKLALFTLPILASLIAFWLGLRFVPLRADDPRADLINRVMSCLVSAFVLGVTALVLLMQHMPGVFAAGSQLATMAGLPDIAGFFAITLCVFVVCSIPGPWIVAAGFLWLQRRKGKDLAELAQSMRDDVCDIVGRTGTSTGTGGTQ